jgi:hypothetical protein
VRLSIGVVAVVLAGMMVGCAAGPKEPLRARLTEAKRMELGWARDSQLRDLGNEAVNVNAIALAADAISSIGDQNLRDRTARANAEKLDKRGDHDSAIIIAELILSDYIRKDTLDGIRKRQQKKYDAMQKQIEKPT